MNHRFSTFRLLLILIFLAQWELPVAGQQTSLVPPTPEAAALFKSTDVPVSFYTGLPNIGVDFYTIKTKELQIPIRINYNARGIQVAEVASRVGIGWALQQGGLISRQVRGFADDVGGILEHNFYNEVFTDLFAQASFQAEIVNGDIDEFPDQFYYDINGESGKFTIDHNDGQVVLQKFSDIKIVPIFGAEGIVGWTVADKMGNKYYYGQSKDGTRKANDNQYSTQEYSFSNLHGMEQLPSGIERRCNSAWHLMEIETYLHERIEFFYELEQGQQYSRAYDKIERPTEYIFSPDNGSTEPKQIDVKCYFSHLRVNQYQLNEIRFPGGKLLFEKDTAVRKDFIGTHALHQVLVKDAQDNLQKGFELTYFYQRCKDDKNQLTYLKNIDSEANYRLFLSQVKEFYPSGPPLPPYQFEYDKEFLPNRHSNAQDSWGFYNGKANGEYLTFLTYLQKVNREVDTALAGAGLLQKISYPTGGYTTFTYEQNRVFPPDFMKELLYNPNNPTDTVVVVEGLTKDSAYFADGIYSKEITIGDNIQHNTPVVFSLFQPMATEEYDPSHSHYQVWLERLDSAMSIYLYPPNTEQEINIAPGEYLLKVVPDLGYDPNAYGSSFMASLEWTIIIRDPERLEAEDGEGVWYGAGKRIKRIEHRNTTDQVKVREYEYKMANGKSSGKMFALPNFHYIQKVYSLNGTQAPLIDQYGSLPGSPLTQLQGNSLGYSMVTEYYGDSSKNIGKTVYEFAVDEDGGDYYKFPYHLPIDLEWLRGLPLKTSIYKNYNGTYELQKVTTNSYVYGGIADHANWLAGPIPFLHVDSVAPIFIYQKDRNRYDLPLLMFTAVKDSVTGEILVDQQGTKIYYQTAGTVDLDLTLETEFTAGGALTTVVKYGYDYPKHYQPIVQKSLTSKGDTLVTQTTYPPDLVDTAAVEYKLVQANRIAVPVRVETLRKDKENVVLSKTVNVTMFKDWGANRPVLPERTLSATNSAVLQNDVIYGGYDSLGAPIEITPKSGVREVYLWGYKGLYPVAKVVGSERKTVVGLVDTTLLDNAAQYSDALIQAELGKLRAGLAGTAEVFTYTYKPLVGMTSAMDQRGQMIYYQYDGAGRLSVIRDHDGNVLKMFCYNYQGQLESCGTIGNIAQSGTFTRNNCGSDFYSTSITYTVAANTYFATNQAAADQLAQQDVARNGQLYANQNGNCIQMFYNVLKTGTFTKQCTSGGSGSQVTYTVEARKYSSTISQADADAKAQAEIDISGQDKADELGSCTWYSVQKSGTYTKQCISGGTGMQVIYTVPEGSYSSTISQADADAKAQQDVNSNGQSYANNNGYCTWYNTAQSGTFTRNNCPYGAVGSQVTYPVAAGAYSSTISQADADQKAINQVSANGQSYANSMGTCLWYSEEKSGSFLKNNCPVGYSGTAVTYTVVTGRYTSSISQDDANMKAQADVNSNGQAYANTNGSCVSNCSAATCSGEGKKCVNGVCEQGVKVFTSSSYNSTNRTYTCMYHYEWSDGSWSGNYSMTTPFACNTGGGGLE